jgi:hypothetical protein
MLNYGPPHIFLLPFIEQDNLWKASQNASGSYNTGIVGVGLNGPGDYGRYAFGQVPPKVYTCPSDPSYAYSTPAFGLGITYHGYGSTSYSCNWQVFGVPYVPGNEFSTNANCVNYPTLTGTFTDGTSNTIVFAEKLAKAFQLLGFTGQVGPAWADDDAGDLPYNPLFAYTSLRWGIGPSRLYCAAPCMFQVKPSVNSRSDPNASNVNVASTPHDAMQSLFADGSVHALSGGVNPATWFALLTPAGGEVLNGSAF